MAFKPESNMLRFTSWEDYSNCKTITNRKKQTNRENRLEEKNGAAFKFQYLVCLIR